MRQQATDRTYLGDAVEEKFHLKAVTLAIIPCIPLTSIKLKGMIHPSIAPIQLEQGLKEGYFVVDLSTKQDFEVEPEFLFSTGYQPQKEADDIGNTIFQFNDTFTNSDEESCHEDGEEIKTSSTIPRQQNSKKQGEADEEEDFLNDFAGASLVHRFNDEKVISGEVQTGESSAPQTFDEILKTHRRLLSLSSQDEAEHDMSSAEDIDTESEDLSLKNISRKNKGEENGKAEGKEQEKDNGRANSVVQNTRQKKGERLLSASLNAEFNVVSPQRRSKRIIRGDSDESEYEIVGLF
ncbi:hypothetical protein [Parasitella parasitica]|uniref:Uncharacterized protein n=1 Tax=Parasitella parasitica TaxID=35722 RepID=A0A0B7N0N2_9FUNG|nr:hypothetical protein [Parasitella parasitica]CEP09332.1 hypothetical protein [Parasitella parasitica]